ncbi:hypothetical protein BDZ45DRAFT_243908 [Acephala macrosclerotiorum]|nr:hypothetical protein BDZ45DRAFT_243908 [Acephala macrosclerotiorum]
MLHSNHALSSRVPLGEGNMDEETGPHFDYVESSIVEELHWNFANTFCQSLKDSNLQINRFCIPECWQDEKQPDAFAWLRSNVLAEVDHFANQSDPCQVFCIHQKNSYSRLYITRELFERLINVYLVFDRIWDFVLPFSFKTRESDIGHAPLRFRQLEPVVVETSKLGSFECAYTFQYVVMNGRVEGMEDNPDYDPWSVRQSTIYQQYTRALDRIMFILIAPSKTAKKRLEEAVRHCKVRQRRLNAFDLHRILVSTLHENWRFYLRSLESSLRDQSDRVALTEVQSETERLSPLTDFDLNFVDQQRLKMIEDKILDLVLVFESLYNTLSHLQRQCRLHCLGPQCTDCTCFRIVEEFEEQMHEAQTNMKKADVLHKRAQGTAQLLSNLLNYENAQIAHLNEKSLNGLAKETKEENSKMRLLTERSTQDAAAVKILTVITLIYLPVTVVASIFSSQLIRFDENGRLSVVAESWWFAVVTVPLTVFTFLLWRYWLMYTLKKGDRKPEIEVVDEGKNEQESWFTADNGRAAAGWRRHLFASLNRRKPPLSRDAA